MADKAIYDLPAATEIMNNDLFVLEQSATAKKLSGQLLLNYLVSGVGGMGTITSIEKTGTTPGNPSVDHYRITFVATEDITEDDPVGTSYTFDYDVTNGEKGDTGAADYLYIKWASQNPTADNQMSSIPDKWIGIAVTTATTAPTHYTDYTWYQYKGETGDSISSISRTSGTGSPGTTDTYTVYTNTSPATAIGTFGVYNGADSPIGYIGSITMATASWTGSGTTYTQSVVVDGVSVADGGKVDLQPDADVIAQMISDGTIALYIQNVNGALTAYAVGAAPTADITVQCVVGNVAVEE